MILFFIAGFISGFVGAILLGRRISERMEQDDKRSEQHP